MSLKERCYIKDLQFSGRSTYALELIDNKVDLANYLTGFMVASPIIEIFKSRGGFAKVSQDIYEYHWDEFGAALGSINPILRKQVYNIAAQEELFSIGKERNFWKCVSDAAL